MARGTTGTAHEPRCRGAPLIQDVEDHTELRIDRRGFDESAPRPAHDDVVVEKERSRVRQTDDRRLHARLGEGRNLRFDGNGERIQYRAQVAAAGLVRERCRAGRKLLVQSSDRIVRLLYGVRDCGRAVLVEERVRELTAGAEPRRQACNIQNGCSGGESRPGHRSDTVLRTIAARRNGLTILALASVTTEKRRPSFLFLFLPPGSPTKDCDIVGAPTPPAAVKVKKGDGVILGEMSIPAMNVAMAKTLFERFKRQPKHTVA